MDDGLGYGLGPNASHLGADRMRAPFVYQVILFFLIFDGVERTAELVLTVVEATTTLHTGITPYQPNYPVAVLWIVVDFLLATLLILRSRAGRIWTQGIVLIHVLYLGHVLVISHPALWLYMGALGRARVAGTLLLDVAAFFWLFTYQAKSYLDR